ncbi:MAG: hypothetical protein KGP27_10320 [Hyphomicrobiales bacterium]|nr:hypothetical protein [Hyphomicrobiales bacterium]
MRRTSIFGIMMCTALAFWAGAALPARDWLSRPRTGAHLELLVFEREACTYCEVFRRDVAPRYTRSTIAADAPLRFIDIDKVDMGRVGLRSKLDVLPTAVLMKDGIEVDRIPGYTGPDIFFQVVPLLLERAR